MAQRAQLQTDWFGVQPGSIEKKFDPRLQGIADALTAHWDFLYQRAEPGVSAETPGVQFTRKRTEATGAGVATAFDRLDQKGHVPGTGKALVFGGGYEVDLLPLLERFEKVEVVDFSPAPLELVRRKYPQHAHKLHLVQADLSGIPADQQARELSRLGAERAAGAAPDPAGVQAFLGSLPSTPERLPFESGSYDLVISPVLNESLPFGPAVTAFENHRQATALRTGEAVPRQAIDEHLGESFFYSPEAMGGFEKLFLHHRDELQRLLSDDGVAVFSSWMRQDEHNPDPSRPLLRVGDSRATPRTWEAFFDGWSGKTEVLREQIYGPDKKPTLNVFVLDR
jgi:SAM-dependent methyltransferase